MEAQGLFFEKESKFVRIRELEQQDLSQLALLYEQFWGDQSELHKMEQELEVIKKEKKHIILVAEREGIVIASVMGILCRDLYGDCRPFLVVENMIVDRSNRKSGIGRMLLAELEVRAKALNCSQIILVTEQNRADACGFYEAYGFQKNNKGYKKKL